MAKIENSKPKSMSGGYERVIGNKELGTLLSKVQSTVISAGNELEKLITEIITAENRIISNADEFLSRDDFEDNVYLLPKKVIKKSALLTVGREEPDFIVLAVNGYRRHCHIIELKDGDMFDTKKSQAEHDNLKKFETYIATKLQFSTSVHICCFNQRDRRQIVTGLKNKITENEALTGVEFCKLLKVDYNAITEKRKQDRRDNFSFFVSELLKIEEVRAEIARQLH